MTYSNIITPNCKEKDGRQARVSMEKIREALNERLPAIEDTAPDMKPKAGANEFEGPCPFCKERNGAGGDNRFVVWMKDEGESKNRYYCRKCPDGKNTGDKIDFHRRMNGNLSIKGLAYMYASEVVTPAPKNTEQKKDTTLPDFREEFKSISLSDSSKKEILDYLTKDRGIDTKVVESIFAKDQIRHIFKDSTAAMVVPYSTMGSKPIVPAYQYIALNGKTFDGKNKQRFNAGSKAGSECFFVAGNTNLSVKTILLYEAVIDAISGAELYPDDLHLSLGGSTLTKKITALKQFVGKKKIIVCQDNDVAGNKMVSSICKILGYEVPCIQWADGDKAGMDMNDLLKLRKLDKEALAERITLALDTDLPSLSDKKKSGTFKLTWVADMKLKPADWLIKGFIEANSMTEIFGPSGDGKTFCVIDMACSIATGTDFNGMPVKQGPVVYVAGEGQDGIKRRLMAWGKHRGIDIDTAKIAVSETAAGLTDTEQVKEVKEAIQIVADEAGPPVAIIFDTIARNFGPGDENNTRDMTQFVNAGDEIKRLYGSAVIYVHHTGLGDQGRARGSSVLKAALDAEYRVKMDKKGIVRMENTKMKDHATPDPMAFKLESVDLGFDSDGELITSAVLISENYVPPSKGTTTGQGDKQILVKGILMDLVQDFINNSPENGDGEKSMGNVVQIPIDDVKARAIEQGISPKHWGRYHKHLSSLANVTVNGSYYDVTPQTTQMG